MTPETQNCLNPYFTNKLLFYWNIYLTLIRGRGVQKIIQISFSSSWLPELPQKIIPTTYLTNYVFLLMKHLSHTNSGLGSLIKFTTNFKKPTVKILVTFEGWVTILGYHFGGQAGVGEICNYLFVLPDLELVYVDCLNKNEA